MKKNKVKQTSFIMPDLRDELAVQRTSLANERTLLAYLRSGVSLILAGVTFIHFSQEIWYKVIGIMCIPLGFIVLLIGTARFMKINREIKSKCTECRI
jgi:putative membrane protein